MGRPRGIKPQRGDAGRITIPATVRTLRPLAEPLESRVMMDGASAAAAAAAAATRAAFDASAAVFVENRGQWADASIRYAFNGQGINVGFTDAGPVLELSRAAAGADPANPARGGGEPASRVRRPAAPSDRVRLAMTFDNANRPAPVGVDRSPTSFNYLVGDASRRRSNVRGYARVGYAGLYDGIDLLAWGKRDGLKYEFHVAPGADWREIRASYAGASGLRLAADGSLRVATPLGELTEDAPVLYQDVNGRRVTVAGRFVLVDADTYGFRVTGKYDPSRELVIDPDMGWSTYLGGAGGYDRGEGIAVDAAGNAYVTGYTGSAGWATAGAYDDAYGGEGMDAFVAKVAASGASVAYVTYLGGAGNDQGAAIAVDAAGNAYAAGYTESYGWATPGAYDTTLGSANGDGDAFIAKLNPSGTALVYATYLGGTFGATFATGIAIDAAGNAYAAGETRADHLTTPGAYDTSLNGLTDAFVAKVSASGAALLYATYLGGRDMEYTGGIAVDAAGAAYVAAYSESAGLATPGAYDTTINGGGDALVFKLAPSGAALAYATYLGGSSTEQARGIAVDGAGNAYVAGYTSSPGWATAGAYDTTYGGGDDDAFVAKLGPTGGSLAYVTYLGGDGYDYASGVAIDAAGNAFVAGGTWSGGLATPKAYDTTYNGATDCFVAELSASGAALAYWTYLGSTAYEQFNAIAVNAAGNVFVAGHANSTGLATPGAYRTTPGSGTFDVLVVKFDGLGDDVAPAVTAAAFNFSARKPSLTIAFSEPVRGNGRAALKLTNLTTGNVFDPTGVTSTYDPLTNVATYTFPGAEYGVLPDGHYSAVLSAAMITDPATNPLDGDGDGQPGGDLVLQFFSLIADVNHDRTVDFNDLVPLAQHYNVLDGQRTWADGDFNGDGKVDFSDLYRLAQRYNTALPGAAAAPGPSFQDGLAAAFANAAAALRLKPKPAPAPKPVPVELPKAKAPPAQSGGRTTTIAAAARPKARLS